MLCEITQNVMKMAIFQRAERCIVIVIRLTKITSKLNNTPSELTFIYVSLARSAVNFNYTLHSIGPIND